MFTEPTVFILGAGASWHYAYPTGEDLVRMVIRQAKEIEEFLLDGNRFKLSSTDTIFFWPRYVSEKWNFHAKSHDVSEADRLNVLQQFAEECRELAKRLQEASPLVIDYFLGKNPSLQNIGKLLIARVILQCEKEYDHDGNTNRTAAERWTTKDNWTRFILHKLMDSCHDGSSLLNNKATFITFNYDLSLEKALYRGLNATEQFQDESLLKEFFDNRRFLHVYGKIHEDIASKSIPDESHNNDRAKHFQQLKNILDISYKASSGIQTIDAIDKDQNADMLQQAQNAIKDAENVYILGYGFDENNNKRLKLKEGLRKKNIYFTNFQDSNRINKKVGNLLLNDPHYFMKNFLNNTTKEIQKGRGIMIVPCVYEKSTNNVYDALDKDFDLN